MSAMHMIAGLLAGMGVSFLFSLAMLFVYHFAMGSYHRLVQQGQPAQARILSVQLPSARELGNTGRFSLEVHLRDGRVLPAACTHRVSLQHAHRLQKDCWVEVRVDPQRPAEVAIVGPCDAPAERPASTPLLDAGASTELPAQARSAHVLQRKS